MSSPAISLTAFFALPLVLAQSLPPILLSVGASPPTYLVTWSSWSLGTYSRSPGAQRQRVDDVAAPARHPAHVTRAAAGPAGEVGLGEHGQPEVLGDEAGADGRGDHADDPALGRLGQG